MNTKIPLKRRRDKSSSGSGNTDAKKSRRRTDIAPFNPHDLRQALLPTLGVILASKLSKASRIRLSTIKDKLSTGQYGNARDYVEDVWSIFEDVRMSNSRSEHYAELTEAFQHNVNPVMKSLGYCCGCDYRFDPQKLCCSLKEECTIAIDAFYFTHETRHNICEACFTSVTGDTVTLADESLPQTRIRKVQFTKVQNNVRTPEPFIGCQDCGRRQHKICVLYTEKIWPNGFVCDNCLTMKSAKRDENQFRAKNLPVTKLDGHIEARVNHFLKTNKIDGGRVHIRMLLNAEQKHTVKPAMRNLFVKSGELSEVFPYRSKAIFAFQEIDGVDLCFFGMYVQEYGSECPDPNTRRVYIEFLDSVNFFQPKSFRTDIYHEILLGYMDFAKQLGYEWLHIWACPPPSGENYIFFGHPPDQKVPDSLRLQRWYTNVLRKGKSENIVVGYKNILEQYKDDVLSQGSIETKEANVAAVARLPYFDEDYWPYFFEETIGKMDEKLKSAKSRQKRSSCKRKTKKQNDNNAAARMNRQRSGLRSKLFSTMAELSESFFSVQLHSAESAATLAPIRDPDSLINNPILNGHSAFFDFARDNSYEFSSLRRAKFSTMLLLYELYNQEIKTEHYVCNVCELRVRTWYHCTVCEDYDLCVDCNEKTGHEHEMHKMGLQSIAEASTSHSDVISIDSDSDGDEILLSDLVTKSKVSSSDSPPASSETVEQSDPLVTIHAGQCTDRDCPIPSCQMVKRFARHLKSCRKTNDNCHICKTLNTVLLSHSDNCRNVNCSFSFCKSTRAQIQRELEQQREKENVDNVMKIAATLQKTSLKMLEHRDVFTDPQFLLNIAFDISNVQIQLQKLIAANYVDCAARIENAPELRFNSRSG